MNALAEPEEELSLGWTGDRVNVNSASETTQELRQHRTTCEEAVAPHPCTCFSLHSFHECVLGGRCGGGCHGCTMVKSVPSLLSSSSFPLDSEGP